MGSEVRDFAAMFVSGTAITVMDRDGKERLMPQPFYAEETRQRDEEIQEAIEICGSFFPEYSSPLRRRVYGLRAIGEDEVAILCF